MRRQNPYQTNTGIHIEWFTVRKSTMLMLFASVLGAGVAATWAYFEITGPPIDPAAAVAADVASEDRGARFLDLDGTVRVRKARTYEWLNGHMGMTLHADDTIRTVGSSHARVRLFDGTEYLIKPDSILVIEEAFEDPDTKAKRVAVKLSAGQVMLQTPLQSTEGSRSDLATPTTEATFQEATTADVRFDQNNQTSGFTIYTGGSDLRAGGSEVKLGPAQAVDVSAERRFSEVITLPDVPTIDSPANLSVIPVTSTTELKWRPVDGARKYRVVLDRSPYFRDPILESTVSGVSILHRGLHAGTYYWQVTAIGPDNREGAPSEFAKFTVTSRAARNAEPPALTVFNPSVSLDGVVTLRGRTDAGAVVTVDRGMGDDRVQVKSDGTFTYYFELRQAGRHQVIVKARRRDGAGVAEKTVYAQIGSE